MPAPPAVAELVAAARGGSARALGRLISAAESGRSDVAVLVTALGAAGSHEPGRAHVIGITGAPGVGKSTTTSALIRTWRTQGRRVAVLAIDPSSPFTGGALLGDRIRMGEHAADPEVFIRSMAARGQLGGLAAAAPQAIRILDAVGFEMVVVETVGVGQSEVDIAAAADTTVVLLAPGMGDGIQAAKAGILEIADVLAVNKSDLPGAHRTVRELRSALALSERVPPERDPAAGRPEALRRVPIVPISAADDTGITELVSAIDAHRERSASDGSLAERRAQRAETEVAAIVLQRLRDLLAPTVRARAAAVADGVLDPHTAARQVLEELDITTPDDREPSG